MMPRMVISGLAAVAMLIAAPALAQNDDDQGGGDQGGWQEAPGVAPVGTQDRVYGKADARFSLIIWLDPECPYCKVLGQQPQHVVDGSGGRVNLAVRLYPLPFHGPNAVIASTTALCVADQAGVAGYYRFLDGWMARTGSNGRGIGEPLGQGDPVADLAAASGARDRNALAGCTTSSRTGQRLAAEMKAGDIAGIEGTPAIAVRDNRFGHTIMVSGAIGEEDMQNAIRLLGQVDDHPDQAPNAGNDAQGVPGGATH